MVVHFVHTVACGTTHSYRYTHTQAHTGSLINVSPPALSPTVLIHLSLLSSLCYLHTQLFSPDRFLHLSNHHPPLIHLIPLSLHASYNYQSCTFTAK